MEALKLQDEQRRYTYADLQSWETVPGERWELIDGAAYQMAAPSTKHQDILGKLYASFLAKLAGKPCHPYIAPLEVRLFPEDDGSDVDYVEPDLFVVCDSAKMDEHGCKGAPDLIVEVLSPSNRSTDLIAKFNKYLDAGVREYWVIDPDEKGVMVFTLENGKYVTHAYDAGTKTLESAALPGCVIDMAAVFAAITA